MDERLKLPVVIGIFVMAFVGIAIVAWLVYEGKHAEAGILISIATLLVTEVRNIRRHLFPGPEAEMFPPERNSGDED